MTVASLESMFVFVENCSQQPFPYVARPCQCGSKVCSDWHVWPVADMQGVSLTKDQAIATAVLLNLMDKALPDNLLAMLVSGDWSGLKKH